MNNDLQLVVGIEMHCELKSHAKAFSKGINGFSDTANVFVSPVDMAFPGTLPIVNKKCVGHAIKMAHILNCKIAEVMQFDRKNYYYPDLPKGYQITQCTNPVGINGKLEIPVDDRTIEVLIHDIHLEEDSASLDHFAKMTTIDYNRAGVPLLEIVTEPCFNSAKEVIAFLEYIRDCYRYCDISDVDTKKGQIRCDVNINLKKDGKYVTPRVEVKNVNGFQNIEAAIKYEEERQKEAYLNNKGEQLVQETRRFDEDANTTISMRTKEDAIDYKYFLDPNIPPYKLEENWIKELIAEIPKLPLERKKHYINDLGLNEYDASILIKDRNIADYFEKCVIIDIDSKVAANWITVNIVTELNKTSESIDNFFITPERLKQITEAVKDNTLSSKQAKEVFAKALESKKEPKEFISKDNAQISDEETLRTMIKEIIANNKEQQQAYLNGRSNLFDYFVGQVMKQTKGKANPVMTKQILKEELEK